MTPEVGPDLPDNTPMSPTFYTSATNHFVSCTRVDREGVLEVLKHCHFLIALPPNSFSWKKYSSVISANYHPTGAVEKEERMGGGQTKGFQ